MQTVLLALMLDSVQLVQEDKFLKLEVSLVSLPQHFVQLLTHSITQNVKLATQITLLTHPIQNASLALTSDPVLIVLTIPPLLS